MVDIGIVLGAAQTLFAALECSILTEICSTLGYKSQLEDLKSTVEKVKSVLLDAADSEELTHTARDYVEKLKIAIYDAGDLFDEFRTVAERKQRLKVGNLSEKVRLFFSSDNPLKVAYHMSRETKKIQKNLDGIACDNTKFGSAFDSNRFAVDNKSIRNRRNETCSYVYAPNIVGREADVNAIVDTLLDLNGMKGVCFLTVVGLGGMGKTTLAQLVCDDKRVKLEFPMNLWWVCVADQDNNQFDRKTIFCKILELTTGSKHHDLSLEGMQKKLREQLEGKKYLIVLDDVWNENKVKWMELKEFLMLGADGSRIVVTTRSHDVAKAIGNSDIHVLEGLSEENSWRLFEMTAFEEEPDSQANPIQVDIGKKIVKQCSNVPLAIKVVGSLLCGQGLDKWRSFERSGLGGIRKGGNQIMSILKFSYNNLEPSVKSCFGYCALFPKDYVIKKDALIHLWMAQGYIVPFDKAQSVREASEEYFLILLRRCFFQDVSMDEHGNVESFKMHDLIHDVAQEVAGHEMSVILSETSDVGDKVRHVFEGSGVCKKIFNSNVKIRSYLRAKLGSTDFFRPRPPLERVFTNAGCLRTVTLVDAGITSLPDSIGELLHLRYLDLSNNRELKILPDSITKLHNLQTLNLERCSGLIELPTKFHKLVNLMHLNIKDCYIRYMPVGMDKLTSLCELTKFVLADEKISREKQVGQLEDLIPLVNIGRFNITMREPIEMDRLKALPARLLSDVTLPAMDMKSLKEVLEALNNRSSLRSLKLSHWKNLCNFSGAFEHLASLESLKIDFCFYLKLEEGDDDGMAWRHLHQNLRSLTLRDLNKLKILPEGMQFLTSLQNLTIDKCSNLEALPEWISCLSSLRSLTVRYCHGIKSIPEAMRNTTSLKRLEIYSCSKQLMARCRAPDGEDRSKIQHIPNIRIISLSWGGGEDVAS